MANGQVARPGHVVQDLCFEVEFETQDEAWQQQDRVSQFAQGPALRIVQDSFDEVLGDGEVLCLETLEVDLGWIAPDELEAQWSQRLRRRLHEQLQSLLAQRGAQDAGQHSADTPPQAHWQSQAQAELDALLHFLQHGHLPWQQAAGDDPASLAERVWQHSAAPLLSGLRALPDPLPTVRRMVRQLPAAWLQRLAAAAAPRARVPAGVAADGRADGRADMRAGLRPTPAPSASLPPWPAALGAAQARLRAALTSLVAAAPVTQASAGQAMDAGEAGQASALELSRQQRRFKALLVDDAPTLSDGDLAELLHLWPGLQHGGVEPLRQQLASLGTLARVRRRMARLWPETLLQQVSALWWPAAASAQCLAWVQERGVPEQAVQEPGLQEPGMHGPGVQEPGMHGPGLQAGPAPASTAVRRQRWLALLGHLWVGGGSAGFDSAAVASALLRPWAARAPQRPGLHRPEGTALSLPTLPPLASTALQLIQQLALLSQQDSDHARQALRASLCAWASTWARQRVLAAVTRQSDLAAWLACCFGAPDAQTVAALAFAPLPQAWAALSAQPPDAARRVQACLHRLVAPGGATLQAHDLVWQWWREMALQVQHSPSALLLKLQAVAGDANDANVANDANEMARCQDWLRWLPLPPAAAAAPRAASAPPATPTPPTAATAVAKPEGAWAAPAPAELLRLQDALARGDAQQVSVTVAKLLTADPQGLRAWLPLVCVPDAVRRQLAQHLPAALWMPLLSLLVPRLRAQELLAGLALQAAAADAPDTAAASAVSRSELTAQRLAQALALALWGQADTGVPPQCAMPAASAPSHLSAHLPASARWQLSHWLAAASQQARFARVDQASEHERAAAYPAPAYPAPAYPTPTSPAPQPWAFGLDCEAALGRALQGGSPQALDAAWQGLCAAPPEAARLALARLAESPAQRAALLGRLDTQQWQALLALFLVPAQAQDVQRALACMTAEVSAHGSAHGSSDSLTLMLREHVLTTLLWLPGAESHVVPGRLWESALEKLAWQLGLAVPALARRLAARLPSGVAPLFGAWSAELSPLDLGRLSLSGGATGSGHAAPSPGAAWDTSAATITPSALALASVIARLRGSRDPAAPALDSLHTLMALDPWQHQPTRAALVRELESAPAARRLARLVDEATLLPLLCWLRPADAAALRQTWPALLALAQAPGTGQAWVPLSPAVLQPALPPRAPPVGLSLSRFVLRELFEEDRPWQSAALLLRAEKALRPVAEPPGQAAPEQFAAHDLFITNAGLVLAAPYLPLLFERLGLIEGKAFVDGDAAQRAVLLIQYAVSGQAQAPESLLMLNKLLCGLALHTPLWRELELTAEECRAVDGMLGAIIAHWKALGTTSLAGLRQTYLQREGRLQRREDAWHLQVQVQTFDVLLDRLPWGFATLKFPWMSEVLHVHWK